MTPKDIEHKLEDQNNNIHEDKNLDGNGNRLKETKLSNDVEESETLDTSFNQKDDLDDYSAKLLSKNDSVYNECTVPKRTSQNKSSIFVKKTNQISSCLPISTQKSDQSAENDHGASCGFTVVNLDDETNPDSDEVRFTNNKSSAHSDKMHSMNSLRLNVNNHIIGGSRNVMERMRKISMSELNRHGRIVKGNKYYKFVFYGAIFSLSLLFLYLIYQNLFNDG